MAARPHVNKVKKRVLEMKEPDDIKIIGQPVPRVDALGKLTGDARYAGDIYSPGMLHLKLLRSDRPHAKILNIQTEAAENHPGVVAVFTYKDIPVNRITREKPDQPVLCDEKVRYIGDPVALVVAESLESAQEALPLIHVDYEDLPGVFSPEEALLPETVCIHENGNLLLDRTVLKGDVEQGLKDSEVVITNTYRTHMVEHAYLEPEAGVANYEEGKLTVWMPSKYAHADLRELAGVLGLDVSQIRIVNTTIGGCFGDKTSLSPGYYAALASLRTKRPSKMVFSREESFIGSRKRHPFIIHYTTGATREGRIVAVDVDMIADAGAYAASTPGVLVKALIHATGPYDIPHVRVRARSVYTNNPVTGSMRGLGVPQVAVAHESQIDLLAETLHLDPFEVRLKNGLRPGSLTATGQRLGESVGLTETIMRLKEEISRRGTPKASGTKKYGWGMASMFYGIGAAGRPNPARSVLEANDSGDFELYIGCGDVGQGSSTVLAQIAAEVLRCKMEKIRVIVGDTDCCPDSGVTAASRLTYVAGKSVEIAARGLRELLRRSAALLIEIAPEDLRFDDGFFYPLEAPRRRISVAQAVKRLKDDGLFPRAEGIFDPETKALDPKTAQGSPMATYAFATQGALVSVDVDSGEVEVLSLVACHDVGKAVNPAGVTGQIEGAVSMGLGFTLLEEVMLKNGRILNPSFSQYFVATSLDMPETRSWLVEAQEPSGPFGAKGVGEPALIPTAPAILNAIHAAIGFRAKELPVTPEKVWRFLSRSNG
jgi:CO/xanthine dehydrogenase Mo-binding subunit